MNAQFVRGTRCAVFYPPRYHLPDCAPCWHCVVVCHYPVFHRGGGWGESRWGGEGGREGPARGHLRAARHRCLYVVSAAAVSVAAALTAVRPPAAFGLRGALLPSPAAAVPGKRRQRQLPPPSSSSAGGGDSSDAPGSVPATLLFAACGAMVLCAWLLYR